MAEKTCLSWQEQQALVVLSDALGRYRATVAHILSSPKRGQASASVAERREATLGDALATVRDASATDRLHTHHGAYLESRSLT